MFFKKIIGWISVLIIIGSFNSNANARTSHDVAIRVAEIGRYHVENKALIANGENLIQMVDVVILSNSDRNWRLVAVPFGDCYGIAWSKDNRIWHNFESGAGETVLTGNRSEWNRYRFYLKVKKNMNKGINLGYQLLFNE